ncbi:conjugative transposon protein TraM [Fluviicola sp.]|uniref:conjugative transposon protein TraM n=1 Tax=Fluviicola sp. TaxID=1917219 RepID=UPI0031DBD7AB
MKTEVKMQRERKFYLVLPIIALPFLTVLFWLLGGGTGASGQENTTSEKALNTQLPGAGSDNRLKDKLAYYEIAEKDSAKMLELMRNDTNYRPGAGGYNATSQMPYQGYEDPTTQQIYQNLTNLERQMQQGYAQAPSRWQDYDNYSGQRSYGGRSSGSTGYGNAGMEQTERDPEIDQLNSMLDKIMEIQNPELANERLKETTEKRRGQVFAVTTPTKPQQITLLEGNKTEQKGSGFYALDDKGNSVIQQNAIRAVVHEDQIIVNGSTIKMRLVDEVSVNGVLIPKDNFIFGTAQLSGERLIIKIESLRFGRSIFPIDLSVFDLDGLDGVYIPGSITRDVVKQSADRPLQSISLSSLDQSWGVQAAGAGVEMVKGMFSKKAKLVRVKVKAGYQILLRDEKQKQSFSR